MDRFKTKEMKKVKVKDMMRGYSYVFIDSLTMEKQWEKIHNNNPFQKEEGHLEDRCVNIRGPQRLENGKYLVTLYFLKAVDCYDKDAGYGAKNWVEEQNFISKEMDGEDEVLQLYENRIMYIGRHSEVIEYVPNPDIPRKSYDVSDPKACKKNINVWGPGEFFLIVLIALVTLSMLTPEGQAELGKLIFVDIGLGAFLAYYHADKKLKKMIEITQNVIDRNKRM